MKKINVLKNSYDFTRIIKNNKPFKYKYYVIYLERCDQDNYKFGLSVGKKIGNAVVRNKYKRRLREIISQKDYQKNFNCIIILSRDVLNKTYQEMNEDLIHSFEKLNIIKEKSNEKQK